MVTKPRYLRPEIEVIPLDPLCQTVGIRPSVTGGENWAKKRTPDMFDDNFDSEENEESLPKTKSLWD